LKDVQSISKTREDKNQANMIKIKDLESLHATMTQESQDKRSSLSTKVGAKITIDARSTARPFAPNSTI
jgi:hypothetical protein